MGDHDGLESVITIGWNAHYIKLGGAIRYAENSLQQWMKGQQRTSTSG
jgi:hypothetical protein